MISGANLLLARIGLLAALGLVWQAVATLNEGLQSSLPQLTDALSALWTLLGESSFWEAVLQTIQSAAIGLSICIVAGVGLGLILSIKPVFYDSASFVIDFLRTVPPLAIIPLGILLYGPSMKLDILMVVVAATWPILLQTLYGVRDVDQALLDTARSYRMAAWRRMLFVVAPACAPAVATGIRISASIALLLSLGTELIAGSPGLGHTIAEFQHDGAVPETYACIVFAGLLGIALNGLVRTAEGRLLEWHHAPRARADR
jgi:ABC-type nitrate/sulfonate/bicarbonate transport system permease component